MKPTALVQIPVLRLHFAAFGQPQDANDFSYFTVEILPNELSKIDIRH